MQPDHGTNRRYQRGCRCDDCRAAAARYQRGRDWDNLRGAPRTVPILGAQRRIEALQALGWSAEHLSERLGFSRAWLNMTIRHNHSGRIYRRNHERIAALYDELSMQLPPETRCTGRQRNMARRNGWPPPLAWDDIDDPDERPKTGTHGRRRTEIDPVTVERLLAGERVPSTVAEKHEAMAQWLAAGRSERSLCVAQGWREGRYVTREDGAA